MAEPMSIDALCIRCRSVRQSSNIPARRRRLSTSRPLRPGHRATRAGLSFAGCFSISWHRRVILEFRNRGIHLVPRLRVGNEEVHLRLEPTWVVQCSRQHSDEGRIARFRFGAGHSRSAFGAKTALVFSRADARREMVTQLSACNSKSISRNHDRGGTRAARHVLAIAAMTVDHHHRFGGDFVTNGAAGAASGNG